MKRLKKYTHRQIKSLISHLKKYRQNQKSETLHQIRVDIKKIKAILSAINSCLKGFKAHRNFIPFRNIFRRAGDVREPDVLARLLSQYAVEGITNNQTAAAVEQLVAAFNADVPHFIRIVKDNAKNIEVPSRHVHRRDFLSHLSRKKKKVKSQLYPRPKMATVHKVRKSLKEIIYLSEIGDSLKKKEAKFYDKVQAVIGQLHDKQVLLGLIKNKKDAAGPVQRNLIKSECVSDKEEIRKLVREYYGATRGTHKKG